MEVHEKLILLLQTHNSHITGGKLIITLLEIPGASPPGIIVADLKGVLRAVIIAIVCGCLVSGSRSSVVPAAPFLGQQHHLPLITERWSRPGSLVLPHSACFSLQTY